MARGSEGKTARKQARKEARAQDAERILAGDDDVNEFSNPANNNGAGPNIVEDSSSDEDDNTTDNNNVDAAPEKKKSKSKSARAKKAAAAAASSSRGGGGGDCCGPAGCGTGGGGSGGGGGIKTLPLVMLVMLTGTTLLPAILYMGDYLSAFIAKNHIMGNLGHRLGIGPSPKKRVLSFYEKHDPDKLSEVPTILSKYYGDYPKLVKRLERKYGDYGYFLNWEKDEAPMNLAFEQLWETKDLVVKKFDLYAPAIVKTGARNMRHNFGFLYKQGSKAWKKTVWPILEPYLGVPDAKKARQQKLKDKKEATGQRRKSAEFRDEDDEM